MGTEKFEDETTIEACTIRGFGSGKFDDETAK